MARMKQEINPKSRRNLKRLCDELDITQKQLSEATGVSENTLSKIATGRGPLTRQIAEEIIKACPTYRIEWLLGFDENPHETIPINTIPGLETAKLCLSVIDLLSVSGIEVGQVNTIGRFLPTRKTRGFIFKDKDAEVRCGDTVVWSGNIRALENVLLEICDFSLFKIEMLQKRMENSNG